LAIQMVDTPSRSLMKFSGEFREAYFGKAG
jgi:hypothetical protein